MKTKINMNFIDLDKDDCIALAYGHIHEAMTYLWGAGANPDNDMSAKESNSIQCLYDQLSTVFQHLFYLGAPCGMPLTIIEEQIKKKTAREE